MVMDDDRAWARVRAVDRHAVVRREYLGDGVYAADTGDGLWLTAEDGTRATDAIFFEPEVLANLVRWIRHGR